MQLITADHRLTFGKYKGSRVNFVPQHWIDWAIANVPSFKEHYEAYKPKFKKHNGNEYMTSYRPRRKTFTSKAKRPVNY